MMRKSIWFLLVLVLCAGAVFAWKRRPREVRRFAQGPAVTQIPGSPQAPGTPTATQSAASTPAPARVPTPAEQLREVLFKELQPVKLTNCELKRFGEPNDGGYLLCDNLLASAKSAYSYGISGYDGWGCEVSKRLKVTVHEYDCFNTTAPACPGGRAVFHAECVAGERTTDKEGHVFDSPEHQFAENGDARKHVVMKIDVEGAEWDTFLSTPDAVFQRIDQLVVEFHGVDSERFPRVVRKLKRFFYIANLHFNNFSCKGGLEPFPAWAYEALFVSKRLGVLDPSGEAIMLHPLSARNNPSLEDCQASPPPVRPHP
jgi:hypothetical protein